MTNVWEAEVDRLRAENAALAAERDGLKEEIARMKEHTWCAYCGLEIHIDDEAATKISEHILSCEKHPIHVAIADNAALRTANRELVGELQNIAKADWRKWDEGLNTPDEFVLWAKSRANAAIKKATEEKP